MFLARKFTRAKWARQQDLRDGEISADALTADLRTRNNSLSFWRCGGGNPHDVEEVVLAIAAAGNRLDPIDIVWLAEADLWGDGQTLQDSEGLTPVKELADRHVDVGKLDYVRLGKVARRVVAAIGAGQFHRLKKPRVRELVATAVRERRIDPGELREGIRREIAR